MGKLFTRDELLQVPQLDRGWLVRSWYQESEHKNIWGWQAEMARATGLNAATVCRWLDKGVPMHRWEEVITYCVDQGLVNIKPDLSEGEVIQAAILRDGEDEPEIVTLTLLKRIS